MAESKKKGLHSEKEVEAILTSDSAMSFHEYLNLFEETEAPREYHTWSLIGVVAALLGKHARMRVGATLTITPNLYVVLLGPPALKKSSAINLATGLVKQTTLNFGPTDTGGQRHGLMSALSGLHRHESRFNRHLLDLVPMQEMQLSPRPPDDMFLVAPELGRLMGSASREMADFLLDLWDGAPIDYQTKAGETRIESPLASLLGATTPSSLASILPDNAASHGILSRILFVYADTVHKSVPLPPEPTEEWFEDHERFSRKLRWIDSNRRSFHLAPEARAVYEHLYGFRAYTEDPRLESYQGRRPTILMKVAMCVAALRQDNAVIESDLLFAHECLHAIEPRMHHALESFGRNKAYHGRLLMLQYLRQAPGQMALPNDLIAASASEMNQREAQEAIQAMLKSGELISYGQNLLLGTEMNQVKAAKKMR